jgi:hypothetical protein
MFVKVIHEDHNSWKLYPLDTDDFYLQSFKMFFEIKLYAQQNFYTIKKNECHVRNCQECKFL